MKLDFVVPGFSKCGTTTLCALLGEHPQIFIPQAKEPGYYADRHDRGWQWYARFFQDALPSAICGEGSTIYSSAEHAESACQRILERFPEARFLFIARDPVRRLASSFREMHHSGYKYGINADYELSRALVNMPNMIADTQYWRLINIYRRRVPDARICVLFLEDFHKDPDRELRRCLDFLGVDSSVSIPRQARRLNPASAKRYDTHLMRFIRDHRWTARIWKSLPAKYRNRLHEWSPLRRPFDKPVRWDSASLQLVRDMLCDDTRAFLQNYGKPLNFWDIGSHDIDSQKKAA